MMRVLQQSFGGDPAWRWFLPVYLVLQAPYVLPILPTGWHEKYAAQYASLLILTAVMQMMGSGIRRIEDPGERKFWRCLATGLGFWWINSIIGALTPDQGWGIGADLLVDSLFGCYYFSMLLAVYTAPHRPQPTSGLSRRLRTSAAAALVLGLSVYFVAIPAHANLGSYLTWAPSFALYAAMDLVLALAFWRLTLAAVSLRWRILYGLLAVGTSLFSLFDALEMLSYLGRVQIGSGGPMEVLWNTPLVFLVLAARLSRPQFVTFPESSEVRSETRQPSPLMLSALVFPLIHILGYRSGLLAAGETAHALREQWVLVCLLLLGALATLEHIDLRLTARQSSQALREARELRLAKAVAEQSMVAKSHFLANVSHEIRTPMAAIVGLSDLLLKTELAADERRYAGLLGTSARGLLTTMDDLLELSRWEAGRGEVSLMPFEIRQLVREVDRELAPKAKDLGLSWTTEVAGDVPDFCLGDRRRVRQVLQQLLSNALKFTAEGGVELRVQAMPRQEVENPTEVRFTVKDTGIGIAEEGRAWLFQPFVQEDASSSRRFGGVGLGLAICRRLVDAMDGRLGMSSRQGEGSRFWFEIPIRGVSEVEPAFEPSAGRQ